MIKRRLNFTGKINENSGKETSSVSKEDEEVEWEMRPGGMLVQKRTDNSYIPAPNLLVRVIYGSLQYQKSVNSRATFGELKKLLTAETELQPSEQRLIFRGKERENRDYLDICGVKKSSKIILMENPESKEKRLIEMRRNAKIEGIRRAISCVSMEVDKLAEQVSAIEKSIAKGNKVPELQITTLTEMLMRHAVKLDSIYAEGDACIQKNIQGERVQKCVEMLDVLKISNAQVKPVVITTNWEKFDPHPSITKWEIFE